MVEISSISNAANTTQSLTLPLGSETKVVLGRTDHPVDSILPNTNTNNSTSIATSKTSNGGNGFLSSLGIEGNPYFSAGAGLAILGIAASSLRHISQHTLRYLQKRMFTSIEIPSKDPSYPWVLDWLSKQEQSLVPFYQSNAIKNEKILSRGLNSQEAVGRSSEINYDSISNKSHKGESFWKAFLRRPLSLIKPPPPHVLSVQTKIHKRENGSAETKMSMVPGIGQYYVKYGNAWIQVERTRDNKMIDLATGSPWESITLKTLTMDKQIFTDILQESKQYALKNQIGKMVIYTSYGPDWRPFGKPRKKRPLSSVILDKDISDQVLKDIRNFLENEKWYDDRGIPYRRGYLLYGPPGTGKTSFIQALAGELDYSVCVLNLSERGMTDDRLAHLLTNVPARSLILLEDIDAAFHRNDISNSTGNSETTIGSASSPSGQVGGAGAHRQMMNMITFSGLLNALDGVASAEERLIFMTTNHIDKLDPALIRPGRVDMKFLIDYASREQINRMFLRFYPEASDLADLFTKQVLQTAQEKCKGKLSPAQLQGHFVMYRWSANDALDNVKNMF